MTRLAMMMPLPLVLLSSCGCELLLAFGLFKQRVMTFRWEPLTSRNGDLPPPMADALMG
jgi:hypothetical protein